jgi:lysophospholipase
MPALQALCTALAVALLRATVIQAQPQSYGPQLTQCPSSSDLLRLGGSVSGNNQTLSPLETAYITERKNVAIQTWTTFMGSRDVGYNFSSLVNSSETLPVMGIAVSGGGYRAALYGAGTVLGLDGRNSTSFQVGTGGVLQMATYLTGLSGGSWFLGSFAIHDMPAIFDLVTGNASNAGWILDRNLLLPDGVVSVIDNPRFYDNLGDDVDLKEAAGYNTSISASIYTQQAKLTSWPADLWGRALSYHFAPGTTRDNFYERADNSSHGATLLWTDVKTTSSFQNHVLPFPIIVADQQIEGVTGAGNPLVISPVPINQTSYEFSPLYVVLVCAGKH